MQPATVPGSREGLPALGAMPVRRPGTPGIRGYVAPGWPGAIVSITPSLAALEMESLPPATRR